MCGGAPLSPENNGEPLEGWVRGRRESDGGFNKTTPVQGGAGPGRTGTPGGWAEGASGRPGMFALKQDLEKVMLPLEEQER